MDIKNLEDYHMKKLLTTDKDSNPCIKLCHQIQTVIVYCQQPIFPYMKLKPKSINQLV